MTTSWDCFDTLVARRRYSPLSVFDEMGVQYSLDNFTSRRKAAESRSPSTLDTIYQELALDYQWSSEQTEYYKSAEIAAELKNCCPVVENINKVKDGDLIVSDMYLPAWAIERILRKNGLSQSVQIFVSTGGKSSGVIWPHLPPIETHIGDNYHSDVSSPNAHGIRAVHYTGTLFTDLEAGVSPSLGQLMRIVRLANPYPRDSFLHDMWLEQSQLNLPVLILASLELPPSGLAFVMRDCIHLQAIHEAIHGTINPALHCSRIAFASECQDFTDYVRQVAFGRLIVDIQGTGNSISSFWMKTFNEMPRLAYVTGTLRNGLLMVPCLHDAIERFNSAPYGTLLDYPNLAECEFSKEVLDCQAAARQCAISHIPHFQFSPDRDALIRLVAEMPQSVTVQKNAHICNHRISIAENANDTKGKSQ